jgi:hypothetical protein
MTANAVLLGSDLGGRPGPARRTRRSRRPTTAESDELKRPCRENAKLRRANDIVKAASPDRSVRSARLRRARSRAMRRTRTYASCGAAHVVMSGTDSPKRTHTVVALPAHLVQRHRVSGVRASRIEEHVQELVPLTRPQQVRKSQMARDAECAGRARYRIGCTGTGP